jgi:hypothetical protein
VLLGVELGREDGGATVRGDVGAEH